MSGYETIRFQQLVDYLQMMMNDFKEREAKYGMNDYTRKCMLDMIACKEMVEYFSDEPVNLQKDGIVTLGF